MRAGYTDRTILRRIFHYSLAYSSHERLSALLVLLRELPPHLFWRALVSNWSACDDTWAHGRELLTLMRRHSSSAPARITGSPIDEFRVYRGCSASRVRGISWTRSRRIAERFAHGHRGIRVPDAVIAIASVRRSGVFLFPRGRAEKEVVLNPAKLLNIRTEPWRPAA